MTGSLAGLRNLSSLAVVFRRGDTAVLLERVHLIVCERNTVPILRRDGRELALHALLAALGLDRAKNPRHFCNVAQGNGASACIGGGVQG